MAGVAGSSAARVGHARNGADEPVEALYLTRVALALVLLPLLVSAVVLIVHVGWTYHATGDNALNELHTRDVPHHPILLGPYSRDGWNHPGPAMYYLLALPYLLGAKSSIGMALGALLTNGAAIAGMALVARRRGGIPLLLFTLVGSALVMRSSGADFLRDWWNPFITVMPYGLLVLLTWAMTCGDAWALPAAVGVASFCIQTHVAYVPLAIPLVLWGAVWLIVSARQGHDNQEVDRSDRPALARATLVAAAVLVVMWSPPLVEQLIHSPGNLTRIVNYFRHPPDPVHSFAEGRKVVMAQFGLTPEWLVGAEKLNLYTNEPRATTSAPLPWLLLPFVGATIVLWRRGLTDACRLAGTVGLSLGLSVFAIARTSGNLYAYRLRWIWVLAMLAFVVVGWAAWSVLSSRRDELRLRMLIALSLAALLVLGAVNIVDAVTAGTPQSPESRRLAALLPEVTRSLPTGDGAVIVRSVSFLGGATYVPGLILGLERQGVTTRIEGNDLGHGAGDHRYYRRGPIRAILYTAVNADIEALSARRELRLIAYAGTGTPSGRKRLALRRARLEAAFRSKKIADDSYLIGVQTITKQLGTAVGVLMKVPVPTTR